MYVGITSLPVKDRWANGKGYKCCTAFQNAINKYTWDSFDHIVVAENLTKQEACDAEVDLIKTYKTTNPEYGYNISFGGDATLTGVCVSEETRAKLSKASKERWENPEYRNAHIGENAYWYGKKHSLETLEKIRKNHADMRERNHPMYGKHHTEESRRKMSEAKKGKKVNMTDEWKKNISLGLTGKKASMETRMKLSESHKGQIPSNAISIAAYNKNEAIMFRSIEKTRTLTRNNYVRKNHKELVETGRPYKGYYWTYIERTV